MAMLTEDVRVMIYAEFAATGRAPSIASLMDGLNLSPEAAASALHALARDKHVVLNEQGAIVMAHPFAQLPMGFSVMGRKVLWWGGCAWDSFALPCLLRDEGEVLVATRCPACRTPHAWSVGSDRPPTGDQVAHFLVPTSRMWDDVVFTCSNQRIYCSRSCVTSWLSANGGRDLGYVLDIETLWHLASGWYEGRLEKGYVRRDPAAASEYLRNVGLTGGFWRL